MTSVKPCNNVLFGRSFAKYCSGKPPGPANQLARQRMDEMYAAIDSVQQPPQWLKPAIGFMMDMHIPLATSGCTSLSNAYRTKLAPDLCAEYPVTLRDNERAMQTVWDCTNPSGFSNLQRLLRKGGPFQSSVRYVQSQLKRGLETPLTQKYVATVCRLSFLGAYPHCAVIASPARRIAVYTTADKDVMQLCRPTPPATTVGSHAYFYMIAEYVSSASLASPSIWAHIKKDARYTAFDRTVRHAADAIRGGKKPPRMSSAVSPRVWTPKATAATFVHAAGVRKKLSLAMITLLGPATIEALYRAAVESTAFSIAFLLQDIVGAARAQSLAECASDAQQKAWLQSLPATTRAAVQVACHGLECRSAVQLMPMHEHAATAQKKAVLAASGKSTYFVTVCRACGTFRNKGVVSGVARARIGIQVTLPLSSQESFACNGCGHSWGLCRVDLVGTALKIKPKVDAGATVVRICCGCGVPSDSLTFNGILPYCKQCVAGQRAAYVECYLCVARKPAVCCNSFQALWRGRPTTFFSCEHHCPDMLGLENVDVELIKRRQKKVAALKNSGTRRRRMLFV